MKVLKGVWLIAQLVFGDYESAVKKNHLEEILYVNA